MTDKQILTDLNEAVMKPTANEEIAEICQEATFQHKQTVVQGHDFDKDGNDILSLLGSFHSSGFQATAISDATKCIDMMIDKKMMKAALTDNPKFDMNPIRRPMTNCTIFLAYTSNMISSGTREVIRYLTQHNMVDCLCTTAGGIEEDIIKCLAPSYLGDYRLPGVKLREVGINRIGNLLVPNDNYVLFEKWLSPILDKMLQEQRQSGRAWTPSRFIWRLGKEINDETSVYYWAWKNRIPVFSPALTDGSLGDILYFHSLMNKDKSSGDANNSLEKKIVLDIVEDLNLINSQAVYAANTGMIILGGGLVKHHVANCNLMRNGADFSVYVNTAQEFEGSDSGAHPDEAVSWGKIKGEASPVKVFCDATIAFPLLVAGSFARRRAEFDEFWSRRYAEEHCATAQQRKLCNGIWPIEPESFL